METEDICFPPLNACFPVSYGSANSAVQSDVLLEDVGDFGEDDSGEDTDALVGIASGDCWLCTLNELFGEEWD